jgi:hypothetical protein
MVVSVDLSRTYIHEVYDDYSLNVKVAGEFPEKWSSAAITGRSGLLSGGALAGGSKKAAPMVMGGSYVGICGSDRCRLQWNTG